MSTAVAYVPTPHFTLAGQASDALAADVLTVEVEETVAGLYRCEARFNNVGLRGAQVGFLYFGRDVLDFGKNFAVQLGPPGLARQVFSGRITALEAEYPPEGGGQIVVLAEDRLQELRMTRRTRVFENASDEDILRQIAQDHGLTPNLSLNGPTHDVVAQVNLSDLAFARERARSVDGELWVDGKTLYAMRRTDRSGAAVALGYGINLRWFTVRADLAHQCTQLEVSGWDVSAKDAILESAGQSDVAPELDGTTAGGDILQQAFGNRIETVVHTVPLTGQEAYSVAQARYRERARRFVTGSGVADGDPRIRAGTTVTLSGLGGLFNGRYYVVRVVHSYDGTNGYRTLLDVERAGLGQA